MFLHRNRIVQVSQDAEFKIHSCAYLDSAGDKIQISTQGTFNFQPHTTLYFQEGEGGIYVFLIMIVCTVYI